VRPRCVYCERKQRVRSPEVF